MIELNHATIEIPLSAVNGFEAEFFKDTKEVYSKINNYCTGIKIKYNLTNLKDELVKKMALLAAVGYPGGGDTQYISFEKADVYFKFERGVKSILETITIYEKLP